VKDGSIVVLGGLLQDTYSRSRNKVPVFGDIPFLGALFGNESRTLVKKNLMIFLRPVIIWDNSQNNKFAYDRYEQMRSLQEDTQPSYTKTQPITQVPVLPKYEDQTLNKSELSALETSKFKNTVLSSHVKNEKVVPAKPIDAKITTTSVPNAAAALPPEKPSATTAVKNSTVPVIEDGQHKAVQFGAPHSE
jgi:general secretion pathway protein D